MKKHSLLPLLILNIIAFTACGTNVGSSEDATRSSDEPALEPAPDLSQPKSDEDIFPRVTITPMPGDNGIVDDAYPLVTPPTTTSYPEGYPEPVIPPTTDPYPRDGDTIWVVKPAGEQCAESLDFATQREAMASLEAAGIETYEVRTVDFMVTASCGSPTSTHYAVEIGALDQANAEALDWEVIAVEELGG